MEKKENQVDAFNKYREIIVLCVIVIIWFVRLESKVLYIEKDQSAASQELSQAKDETKKEIASLQSSINALLLAVGRVEGKLERK